MVPASRPGVLPTAAPDPLPASPPTIWQRLWRRPLFKRMFYEGVGLMLRARREHQMLNCGYLTPGDAEPLPLPPEAEAERAAYQLYHRLGTAVPLAGREVLETGCGAGAGARFLSAQLHPHRYTGVDASRMLIRAARRRGGPPALEFRTARAERLPFADAAFDVVLALEAVHPLPDKPALVAELARVLRPGGHLVIADFFYTRTTSPSSLAGFQAALAAQPFRLLREEDWTPPVRTALEADSPRRLARIARLPRFLHPLALQFAGTVESPLYRQLTDGRARYLHFVARRT